jgi:DNA invertase Pin-like site-specific DNA recombinase
MKIALYARVSTTDKGQDVEMQLRELRDYATKREWRISGEYVDNGVSGSKDRRPHLDRMMTDAKRRKFDAVVVWKLDRFGRSLRHLVTAISELDAVRVAFVSLRDGFDLTTPSGRLQFHIVAAMAEFERELIRERTRAGISNARAKGKTIGRPRESVDLAAVTARRAAGESLRAIARDLRVSPALLCKRFSESSVSSGA